MCVKRLNSLIEFSSVFFVAHVVFLLQLHIWNLSRTITTAWNKSCFVKFSDAASGEKNEHSTWNAVSFDKQSNRLQWHSDLNDKNRYALKKQRQRRRRWQENEKKQKPFAMQYQFRLEIIRYLEIVSVCRWIFFPIFRWKKTLNERSKKNICSLI